MNIFEFKSYKDFLKRYCESERGSLSRLAEAADCQKSYLSSLITGSKAHLNIDQAYGIADYLQLSDEEQDYLFLLIDKDKATNPKHKKRLDTKCKEIARESFRIKNRQNAIVVNETSSDIGFFFSTWTVNAVHILTSIPEYQNTNAIAKRLDMPVEVITPLVQYLEKLTLIKRAGEKVLWNSSNIHLPDASSWIGNHHTNWRFRAVENIQKMDRESVHYSAVQSFSAEDFERLKRKLVNVIAEFNKIADPSEPEEAYCFNLDLFKI